MAYPVHPVTRPADLAGQPNGQLPSGLLIQPGFAGRPAGRLHRQTARSWNALAAAVHIRYGETLTVTSTHDAYRSYAIQESTFRIRYTTTVLEGRPRKWWNGQWWYQRPGTAMSAVPGTSNHGWGLAVDACYWRNGTAVGITTNGPCFSWMLANAHLYGFSWEVQSEPWHLRLFTGDNTPKAVIDFEKPQPPPPPPPPPAPPAAPTTSGELMDFVARFVDDRFWYVVRGDLSGKRGIAHADAMVLVHAGSHKNVALSGDALKEIPEYAPPLPGFGS